ncbi:hypothetical protein [Marivita hallyeonensis]|uniref:hypothetical protein n=1 Tax=Marivita hallyeonensis TaxID=996342 RepID=UPI001C4A4418|nr:hypothetical protein [Marivita hallyeonensis]
MNRWISVLLAVICASVSGFVYEANVNSGHSPFSRYHVGATSGFAAGIWAWNIFSRMGQSWWQDLLWICAAFPLVGALAGALIGFGHPIGIIAGVQVALRLPQMFPEIIVPVYLVGAVAAFILPRKKFQFFGE